ncbi:MULTISPECIES: type II secretion system protein [unclassified Microbacterium]|nr:MULTISPECIES: type II secretion system protein [unclassified Microbacterium]MCR2785920.1 type II secretion system GspH family protein [Microbacterium sp. zg.B96]MDL5349963.1 type II secretion system protein [Microbacterium sp. zg-YB36]WIM17105.1 type II secretion system protein [Microbacterium sp. zg-B96]
MTLIELVVAMGVFGILLTLVVSMFVGAARLFSDQQGAIDNSRLASTSMNEVTRIIRAGTEIPVPGSTVKKPVFAYAGAEKIIIHSFIDAGTSADPPPVRVEFARNSGNELIETRWAAHHEPVGSTYWAFASAATSSRPIARSLTPVTAGAPLFRYYDQNGGVLSPPAGASLTIDQIRTIASVQVTMRVQADASGRVEPVSIQNMVGIPNLGVARVDVHG